MTLIGCGKTELSPVEYARFINGVDNGFVKIKTDDSVKYRVQWMPSDLVVVNELRQELIKKEIYDSLTKSFDNAWYFKLTIQDERKEGITKDNLQDDRPVYRTMHFGIESKLKLIFEKDTLKCKYALLDENNSNAAFIYQLAFEKKKNKMIMPCRFMIEGIAGGKSIEIPFEADIPDKLPSLKTY